MSWKHGITRRWLKGHRDWFYQQSIAKVLEGKAPPEYMAARWGKYKEIKGTTK